MNRKWEKFKHLFSNADCQLHTVYTDGKSTPEEYFQQAETNGLDFILFSEHVRRVTTYDYLKFKEHVYDAGSKSKVQFAVGAEAKVLNEEGDIDISKEISDEAEMVLFSFHTPAFPSVESYKKAIKNAASNPIGDVFAHPTFYHNWQNLTLSEQDWIEILHYLAADNICYEFNKKYPLPTIEEINAINATEKIQIVFGSDAHQADHLLVKDDMTTFLMLLKQ